MSNVNIEKLKELRKQGLINLEIAKSLGIKQSYVSTLVKRFNLPKRMHDKKELDPIEFRKLYLRGISCANLAKHFDTYPNYVYEVAKKLGLPPRRKGVTKEIDVFITEEEVQKDYAVTDKELNCLVRNKIIETKIFRDKKYYRLSCVKRNMFHRRKENINL